MRMLCSIRRASCCATVTRSRTRPSRSSPTPTRGAPKSAGSAAPSLHERSDARQQPETAYHQRDDRERGAIAIVVAGIAARAGRALVVGLVTGVVRGTVAVLVAAGRERQHRRGVLGLLAARGRLLDPAHDLAAVVGLDRREHEL